MVKADSLYYLLDIMSIGLGIYIIIKVYLNNWPKLAIIMALLAMSFILEYIPINNIPLRYLFNSGIGFYLVISYKSFYWIGFVIVPMYRLLTYYDYTLIGYNIFNQKVQDFITIIFIFSFFYLSKKIYEDFKLLPKTKSSNILHKNKKI